MASATIYFATNRRHEGPDRWKPTGYGIEPSRDQGQNLRFGTVLARYEQAEVDEALDTDCGFGVGDGDRLAVYFRERPGSMSITAFKETLEVEKPDAGQPAEVFGSTPFLDGLRDAMEDGADVVVLIHGFNVDWWDSVSSAFSLEFMLNRDRGGGRPVKVVLFSWPSNGRVVPYRSYFSDREDAEASALAVGRGLLKLRDYLIGTSPGGDASSPPDCGGAIHLLCHSMGNYVLQGAVAHFAANATGRRLPRLFHQVLLCAADVDDDVLERGGEMWRLPEMGRRVTVYHSDDDKALWLADKTKGLPDRLGARGPRRANELDDKVYVVDCGPAVRGGIEHSYYRCGRVNDDIRECINNVPPDQFSNRAQVGSEWPRVSRLL